MIFMKLIESLIPAHCPSSGALFKEPATSSFQSEEPCLRAKRQIRFKWPAPGLLKPRVKGEVVGLAPTDNVREMSDI